MIKNATLLLCLLALMSPSAQAEEPYLPFHMPIPDGWRTESLTFPLEFAPSLPYRGLEEVRFAPGMFEQGREDFWTYTFVWWVGSDADNNAEALSAHLETYFRGLAEAVASSRQAEVDPQAFSANISPGEDRTFSGKVETFDPFVTLAKVRLNVHGRVVQCLEQGHQAILFGFSPQDSEHSVWKQLIAVQNGFQCTSQDSAG